MQRDELYARVEVLKLAQALSLNTNSNAGEAMQAAAIMWSFVMPEGEKLDKADCGCGGSKHSNPGSTKGFTGTHVVPFSWVPTPDKKNYKLFVMNRVFAEAYPHGYPGSTEVGLRIEGAQPLVFSGEGGMSAALEAANRALVEYLNAHVDEVAAWLAQGK